MDRLLSLFSILVLMLFWYELALLSLFLLMHDDGIFDFLGLYVPLLLHDLNVLSMLFLSLLFFHFILHFLLGTFLILSLQPLNIICSLFSLFNFLPRFHFFLLKQRNSIRKQLSISLNLFSVFFGSEDAFGWTHGGEGPGPFVLLLAVEAWVWLVDASAISSLVDFWEFYFRHF